MEKKRILLCLAHMSGNEMKYIEEAFADNWVVPLGPNVNGFEEDLEKFVNSTEPAGSDQSDLSDWSDSSDRSSQSQSSLSSCVSRSVAKPAPRTPESRTPNPEPKKVVALSAGTAAVHLALIACGVKPGDEVMVQSFTFCASAHPVTYLGATPVFVDSEAETWNIDPELLDRAIADRIAKTGRKPKAIVPVALYGMPYKIDEIMKVAEKYGIPVIEDAAEGFGSRYNGRVLGTFGRFGVLSFNGNKMITTSGGGALICPDEEAKREVMWYATQARESYPYYQHEAIGYNYRMSNICAGIGRGQMTVLEEHIAHHKHIQQLYCELLRDVPGITMHTNPGPKFDSNFWLCTATLDPDVKVVGQEDAYKEVVKGAVGGAAGVIHAAASATTDCQPNANVEALRVALDKAGIEMRPLWKPMHRQPVYRDAPAYVNGVSESLFKVGFCLPAGPWVTDDDVRYIVSTLRGSLSLTEAQRKI